VFRWVLVVYLALLAASWMVRRSRQAEPTLAPAERAVTVAPVRNGADVVGDPVRMVVLDMPNVASALPPVVLLHGSPGSNGEVGRLTGLLAADRRALAPNLPGFGGSTHRVPDYSIRSHARYVLAMLDSLGIERAHLLGFSMGGGVAVTMADLQPSRVASITLLSAIGAQEYELLGDYRLNHAVHGIQLAGLWLLREATPHFGALDGCARMEHVVRPPCPQLSPERLDVDQKVRGCCRESVDRTR
jgi:pimeloyl-ACP methyl ester carboxylesterase